MHIVIIFFCISSVFRFVSKYINYIFARCTWYIFQGLSMSQISRCCHDIHSCDVTCHNDLPQPQDRCNNRLCRCTCFLSMSFQLCPQNLVGNYLQYSSTIILNLVFSRYLAYVKHVRKYDNYFINLLEFLLKI